MATLQDVYNLASNAEFKSRISAAVAKASYDVMNEAANTPNHAERLIWANTSMKDPDAVTEKMVWAIVQNSTIQASALNSTDNDIQFVVNSNVDIFAV